MRISPPLPAAISNKNAPSLDSSIIKKPSGAADLSVSAPVSRLEKLHSHDNASRFRRIEGLSAKAQSALQAYHNTEAMAADNPRNQLIGVDVFA